MVLPDGTSPYVYTLNGVNSNLPVFPGLDAGTYVVGVSDADGCGIEFEEIVLDTCDVITSISQTAVPETPVLYPNPATDIVNIMASGYEAFEVHDPVGRMVVSETLSGGRANIDVSLLEPGMYLVEFSRAGSVHVERLLKR